MSIEQLNGLLHNGYRVFQHYIAYDVPLSKNLISPFVRDSGARERHGSFQLYCNKSGMVCFKDHGCGLQGSHWDFVMAMEGVDFREAVSIVKRDILEIFSDGDSQVVTRSQVIIPSLPKVIHEEVEITTIRREMGEFDYLYFARFGIKDISLYHVYPASEAKFSKGSRSWSWKQTPSDPIYEICFDSGRKKIYRPLTLDRRNKWASNVVSAEDVFCFHLLPEKADKLFITAGNKDTMSFHSTMGLYGVPLNSESASLSMELYNVLSMISDKIYSIGNMDAQGDRFTEKLLRDYNIQPAREVLAEGNHKDFAAMIESVRHNPVSMSYIRNYYHSL